MFDSEAKSATPSAVTSMESIAQWKVAVQNYFSGEWDNLRELIREIEESDWDNARLEIPNEPQQSGKTRVPFHQQIAEQLRTQTQQQLVAAQARAVEPARTQPKPVPELPQIPKVPAGSSQDSDTPIAADPPKPNRLADLAKRLELRLKENANDA